MGYGRTGKTLDVFLNYACQAKCPFCFNPALTPELTAWKLSLSELSRLLLQKSKDGYRCVIYSGGEVTLLNDLPKILMVSRKAGYSSIGIISNGLLMADRDYTDRLIDSGLNLCSLSVHGADASTHDRMVCLPGAFEKIERALEHLERRKISVALKFVLTKDNFTEAPAFINHFASRADIEEFHVNFPHYDGLMADNAASLGIKMSAMSEILGETLEAARRYGAHDKLRFVNFTPCAVRPFARQCVNWERDVDDLLMDQRGVGNGEFSARGKSRVKTEACRACTLDERCLGYESSYTRLYGTDELRPITDP
jgi:MoaA/NifB/PqqE/SkfB family radical SAM enzyme